LPLSGRTFANDEGGDDPSRVGGPTNALVDGVEDFATVISFRDNNTGVAKDLQRAARAVSQRSGEKTLAEGFRAIQDMCEVISLTRHTTDTPKQLYKRVYEEKILKGKPNDAVVAACIFVACRQARVPRTFQEIVNLTGVEKKKVAACFKILKLKFENTGIAAPAPTSTSDTGAVSSGQIAAAAEDIVIRFSSNLALPPYVSSAACEVCRKVTDLGVLAGRNPVTIATACIFFTAALFGTPKAAKDVAAVGGMAESTIRHGYRLILPYADQLINPKWTKADKERLP